MEKNREQGIGMWRFGYDCQDWVVARSEDEAVGYYERTTGMKCDEYEEVVEVEDLDALTFVNPDNIIGRDEDGKAIYERYSARKAIQESLNAVPNIVATTEW